MFLAKWRATQTAITFFFIAAIGLPISHALERYEYDESTRYNFDEFTEFKGLKLAYNGAQLVDYLESNKYSIRWELTASDWPGGRRRAQEIPVFIDGTKALEITVTIEEQSWLSEYGNISVDAIREAAESFSIEPIPNRVSDIFVFDDPRVLPDLWLQKFVMYPSFFEAEGLDIRSMGRALLDRFPFVNNSLYSFGEKGMQAVCPDDFSCYIGFLETDEQLTLEAPLTNQFAWRVTVGYGRPEVRARWLEEVMPKF